MFAHRNKSALRARPLTCALLLALGAGITSAAPTQAHALPSAFGRLDREPDSRLLQHIADIRAKRARAQARERSTSAVRPVATLAVTSCSDAPDEPGSLRGTIAAATSGDTIDLSALTCSKITLTQGQIPVDVENLTLLGPGRDALTIDAGSTDRHFYHHGTGSFAIENLTITNGLIQDPDPTGNRDGGCILSLGTIVLDHTTVTNCELTANGVLGGALFGYGISMTASTVSNSIATGNVDARGGGVFVLGDAGDRFNAVLRDSLISGNTVVGPNASGGGLYLFWSRLEAGNTAISNNISMHYDALCSASGSVFGGGVGAVTFQHGVFHMVGTIISLTDSSIEGNTAKSDCGAALGGGIHLYGPGDTVVETSTISGNVVAGNFGYGAGILSRAQADTAALEQNHYIRHSTISGNVISGEFADNYDRARGGGILTQGVLWLEQSTVTGNRVETGHVESSVGGVYSMGGLQITGSTIAFNSTLKSAGGLQVTRHGIYEIESNIVNSIISGNVAPTSADVSIGGNPYYGAIMVQGGHNLVGVAPDDPDVVLPADTIYGDAHLLPLAWNGGPTRTHALGPGSPAFDAGAPSNEAYDQRGFPFARTVGAGPDIGAVERQISKVGIDLSFDPDSIEAGAPSTLTLTLVNTFPLAGTLTAPLIDAFPQGIVVASPANVSTTCTGVTFTADEGVGSVALFPGTQIPIGYCTFSVDVTAATSGAYVNTLASGVLSTTLGVNSDPASATLIVNAGDAIFTDGFDGG